MDTRITSRFLANRDAQLLATIPGVNTFIALAIASRIAPIERFPHGRSLANFLGLTPGCRSSGETERPGSITKAGSRMVRSLIGQVILHLLRKDGAVRTWYQRIKRRRGSRIARVAVMRRTAAIMQRMLSKGEPWRAGKVGTATSEAEKTSAGSAEVGEEVYVSGKSGTEYAVAASPATAFISFPLT